MMRETQINRGMRPPGHTTRRTRGFSYLTSCCKQARKVLIGVEGRDAATREEEEGPGGW